MTSREAPRFEGSTRPVQADVVDLDTMSSDDDEPMASLDEESPGPAPVVIQRSVAQLKKAPKAVISRSRSFNCSGKKAEVKKRARAAGGRSRKTSSVSIFERVQPFRNEELINDGGKLFRLLSMPR